jgi:hypothetical protein
MKFRKLPVIIEAEQFWHGITPWPEGVYCVETGASYGYRIKTLEGEYRVIDGDWIITGVKGEKYSCDPDIFAMTYEEV